tara:strand:- start:542 stop:772 length:231 start_codon:yes stop_codon:yes gene_type:complete
MRIDSAFNYGVEGFQKSQQLLNKTANNIASLNNKESNVNLNEEAVNLIRSEIYGKANGKVIQTSNDMIGTLLDIKA